MTTPFILDNRAVLTVTGPDAATFLNGLLTCATSGMSVGERQSGALLTPQGKIICEMLLEQSSDGFLIDCDMAARDALVRRLTLFRLRAAVDVAARDELGVAVFTGSPDPRSPGLPARSIVPRSQFGPGDTNAYHLARIAAGIPEQGSDFGPEEVFPADVNFDLIGSVDFRKGCFVGQEVVSRMKRRGSARRRTLQLQLTAPLAGTPCPVLNADGVEIGQVTSQAGGMALARLRIDRLAETNQSLTVDAHEAHIVEPHWLRGELAALAAAQATRA